MTKIFSNKYCTERIFTTNVNKFKYNKLVYSLNVFLIIKLKSNFCSFKNSPII